MTLHAGPGAGRRPHAARHRARHARAPRPSDGEVKVLELKMNDRVERDDVVYVRESVF